MVHVAGFIRFTVTNNVLSRSTSPNAFEYHQVELGNKSAGQGCFLDTVVLPAVSVVPTMLNQIKLFITHLKIESLTGAVSHTVVVLLV